MKYLVIAIFSVSVAFCNAASITQDIAKGVQTAMNRTTDTAVGGAVGVGKLGSTVANAGVDGVSTGATFTGNATNAVVKTGVGLGVDTTVGGAKLAGGITDTTLNTAMDVTKGTANLGKGTVAGATNLAAGTGNQAADTAKSATDANVSANASAGTGGASAKVTTK